MAGIIGELLIAIVRGFLAEAANLGFLKIGAIIERKTGRGAATVVIGMIMGLAAYILIPVLLGVLGL